MRDAVLDYYDVGERRSLATMGADAFEAFMWGAFVANTSIVVGFDGQRDFEGFFTQAIFNSVLETIGAVTSIRTHAHFDLPP